MFLLPSRPRQPRRGVTLVEMLVVVALLVLMMTIIVQIFSAATGAVTVSKVYQGLDDELRQLDSIIRKDLGGVTARLNPPLDPGEDLGYFEYIENSPYDAQGEDTDDCLRFTAKAPPNQPFTGRFYVPASGLTAAQTVNYLNTQPITITSDFAEIVYFLRNGNLYRRVLLIAPQYQQVVNSAYSGGTTIPTFFTAMFGGSAVRVSWQGVNDLSARPSPITHIDVNGNLLPQPPILNTLGDLTNRENRIFSPRLAYDFDGNGISDDYNLNSSGVNVGDGVADYYPTLYPGVFTAVSVTTGNPLHNEILGGYSSRPLLSSNPYNVLAFPYIFPGAYSQPDPNALGTNTNLLGWIHSLDPTGNTFNHAPLDLGDSLAVPNPTNVNQLQTWWGFPTWRETMSPNWTDPQWQLNVNKGTQATGLQPISPTTAPASLSSPLNQNLLPSAYYQTLGGLAPQLFSDGGFPNGVGSNSAFTNVYYNTATNQPVLSIWQDDLLMTGVRSFDVKGYDNAVSGYVDLGYAGDYLSASYGGYGPGFGTGANALTLSILGLQTLGHEGLIPPRPLDYRFDPQAEAKGIFLNIGDSQTSVIRLRRTWDSWSTDYTEAPSDGYDPNTLQPYGLKTYPPGTALTNSAGYPANMPVYPSYPPPYPVPLRGIQIQVRVVDPRNERVKVLTIRQDFSDKIYKQR